MSASTSASATVVAAIVGKSHALKIIATVARSSSARIRKPLAEQTDGIARLSFIKSAEQAPCLSSTRLCRCRAASRRARRGAEYVIDSRKRSHRRGRRLECRGDEFGGGCQVRDRAG